MDKNKTGKRRATIGVASDKQTHQKGLPPLCSRFKIIYLARISNKYTTMVIAFLFVYLLAKYYLCSHSSMGRREKYP